MTCYLNLPEVTRDVMRDGWIMTRDIGTFDERGFLYLFGRRDEMINSGGFNVAPREVENVLSGLLGVEEVAVVGIPDERWGSAVAAIVKLLPNSRVTATDLIEYSRPRLGYRTPKVVAIVDAIPKNSYGKIDRGMAISTLVQERGRDNE